MVLTIGARESKLSQVQVAEVMSCLPEVEYQPLWIKTVGDRDLKTPLGPMGKTDFFTREIDEALLNGGCRVAVHSAKDLPDPLPKGLKMVALTKGVDPSDVLVMPKGMTLETLPKGARIGSSSPRRDRVIHRLRPDLICHSIRGGVDSRLTQLDRGDFDGLVCAEAALIRLGETARNRIVLPGGNTPLQGRLAILAREGDQEMETLFSSVDIREKGKVLHLGLSVPHSPNGIHHPLIKTLPRPFKTFDIERAFVDLPEYTHLIFTSKVGAAVFIDCISCYGFSLDDLKGKEVIVVGQATKRLLEEKGVRVSRVAEEETQEGVIKMLSIENFEEAYVLLPQSSLARPHLAQWLGMRRVRYQQCTLYETHTLVPKKKLDLTCFDKIVFTSPSTVDAFKKVYNSFPKGVKAEAVGPITRRHLNLTLSQND
ncbi:MAG: hydroxymethylbilane synthase [Chlamydiia bacterium]|nr:hydroxymethylbilane synthase [Chlamydiia bacterium]